MPVEPAARPARHSGKQNLILLALALLAVGTFVILPSLVPEAEIVPDAVESEEPRPASQGVKPSDAAEQTHFRQEAQAVLAEIIAMREGLEAGNVSAWGAAPMEQAVKQVEAGDAAYGYGRYEESLADYREALRLLQDLEASGASRLSAALKDGIEAVEALNLPVAESNSALALQIAPEDEQVKILQRRVTSLPEVAARFESGDAARERGEFTAARAAYQRAVELDPDHQRAAKALAEAGGLITDAEFRNQMSRGLAALEQRDFDAARKAFRQAGTIRPGDPAVQKGLQQVDNEASMNAVSARLSETAELESREEWQQAVDSYRALLEEDPSIVDARVRLVTAEVRADLDRKLQAIIDDPLALSSERAYQAAQTLAADAREIAQPGARLRGQIESVDRLLATANSPVEVVFQSDNLTHVTLFRIADLGRFDQTAVTLRPGRYIAAGTRSGYRDVRIEFTVTGQSQAAPIVVRCDEAI